MRPRPGGRRRRSPEPCRREGGSEGASKPASWAEGREEAKRGRRAADGGPSPLPPPRKGPLLASSSSSSRRPWSSSSGWGASPPPPGRSWLSARPPRLARRRCVSSGAPEVSSRSIPASLDVLGFRF